MFPAWWIVLFMSWQVITACASSYALLNWDNPLFNKRMTKGAALFGLGLSLFWLITVAIFVA